MLLGVFLLNIPFILLAKESEAFAKEVSFVAEGKTYDLQLTGTAVRKKFVVKVYDVGHYLEKGAVLSGDKFEQILNDDKAKQLTMKWIRSVTAEQIQNGYKESFKAVLSPEEQTALNQDINTFIAFFNVGINKGGEQVLRWIPGGTIEFDMNGAKVGSIKNPAFAKGLWSIWFGPHSVVNRDNLVSQIK